MTSPINATHWTKDFVEHLRTVHFSLVVLCIGLIVITSTQFESPARRARVQLHQIAAVAMRLSPNEFDKYCRQVEEHGQQTLRMSTPGKQIPLSLTQPLTLKVHRPNQPIGQRTYWLDLDCKLLNTGPRSRADASLSDPGNEGEVNATLALHSIFDEPMNLLRSHPQTLQQFAAEWDLLNLHLYIVIPTSLYPVSGKEDFSFDSNGPYSREQAKYTYDISPAERPVAGHYPDGMQMRLEISRTETNGGGQVDVGAAFPQNLYYDGADDYVQVASYATVPLDGFFYLLEQLPESERTSWRQGTFAEAFPELNAITKGRQAATYRVWDDSLRDEIIRTSDAFEAFGLKIPSQATALWGSLLVLGVQLYMLTHLIELARKIEPSDPGWEVAWIGIYQRRLAKVLFVGSTVLLPPSTIFIVAYKGLPLFVGARGAKIEAWSLLIAGVLSSAAAALFSARCLPQKVDSNAVDSSVPGSEPSAAESRD